MSAEDEIRAKQAEDVDMQDESDRLLKEKHLYELERQREEQLMSSVLKQKLPRPAKFVKDDSECDDVELLIHLEMKRLIERDNFKYPLANGRKPKQPTDLPYLM